MKKCRILFVSIFACMLLIPLAALNTTTPSVALSAPVESGSTPSMVMPDIYNVGAIEGIVTQIDPEGGVRNAVGTFQNASYYGITYTAPYQAAVESQMATDAGYVSLAQLEVAGRSVFPNGRVGGTAATLTVMVNPIVVLPANPADLFVSTPTLEQAQDIADDFVALYETDLSIEFERLTTMRQSVYVSFDYEGMYSISDIYEAFMFQFVSLPESADGDTAMTSMRTRLSGLGGFMDLLQGTEWPVERTSYAETLLFHHISEQSMYYSDFNNPFFMYTSMNFPYVRADASHTDYLEKVECGVIALAGFDTPAHITDGTGTETYSLKQHVGYTGDIESKMFQDLSINSISSIVAIAPNALEINGVATDWDYIGKDFRLNGTGDLYLPTGNTISANSTADEIIQAMIVSYPQIYAMQLNQTIGMMDPEMFDMFIDNMWASPGPFPDMREYFLEFDWSMAFTSYPVEEVNQDALRLILEEAGITPDSLMDKVNQTMIEEDPMRALVEAVIECFDNYHLLDILENTTYSNPYELEGFINEYIGNIDTFLANFTGVDLPSSYATKEAFAALIEDHFGLVLQGLWDAMADFTGDTTNIKAAVQAMIDPIHLAEETVPYFMADMYSSAVSEYDYGMYLNFDLMELMYESDESPLLWLTTEDVELTFDLDLSTIDFDGPHCIIRKSAPQVMNLNTDSTVTITVENIGDATAYDLKILDGISAGFDSDKQYYWNLASLPAGDSWTVTVTYTPVLEGTYAEVPAILCYFNATLTSFDPLDMENWGGAAFYTTSAVFSDQRVRVSQWWEGDILGIPTIIIMGGGIGAALIVIVVIVKKRA